MLERYYEIADELIEVTMERFFRLLDEAEIDGSTVGIIMPPLVSLEKNLAFSLDVALYITNGVRLNKADFRASYYRTLAEIDGFDLAQIYASDKPHYPTIWIPANITVIRLKKEIPEAIREFVRSRV